MKEIRTGVMYAIGFVMVNGAIAVALMAVLWFVFSSMIAGSFSVLNML